MMLFLTLLSIVFLFNNVSTSPESIRERCISNSDAALDEARCRPSNDTSQPLCSNRGICVCGACECNKLDDPNMMISGQYCECDNFSCVRRNGLICSGPEHGTCVCGKCACRQGYRENAWGDCFCPDDISSCRSPDTGDICSGHGNCVCGHCECNADADQQFSGKYCERCPTCPSKCSDFKECVECIVHRSGPLYNPDAAGAGVCDGCAIAPTVVEGTLEENNTLNEYMCKFYDDKDCLLTYTYYYDNYWRLNIRAKKELECPQKTGISKFFYCFG